MANEKRQETNADPEKLANLIDLEPTIGTEHESPSIEDHLEQKLLVFRQRGAHKWVPKKEIRSDDSKGETEFQTLHSPCVCFQSSEPSVAMKESVGPLNPLRKVMLASQPYEAVRTWSTQMTLNENAEPTAIPLNNSHFLRLPDPLKTGMRNGNSFSVTSPLVRILILAFSHEQTLLPEISSIRKSSSRSTCVSKWPAYQS